MLLYLLTFCSTCEHAEEQNGTVRSYVTLKQEPPGGSHAERQLMLLPRRTCEGSSLPRTHKPNLAKTPQSKRKVTFHYVPAAPSCCPQEAAFGPLSHEVAACTTDAKGATVSIFTHGGSARPQLNTCPRCCSLPVKQLHHIITATGGTTASTLTCRKKRAAPEDVLSGHVPVDMPVPQADSWLANDGGLCKFNFPPC